MTILIVSFAVVGATPGSVSFRKRGGTSAALWEVSASICSIPSWPSGEEENSGPGIQDKGLAETKNEGVGTSAVPRPHVLLQRK